MLEYRTSDLYFAAYLRVAGVPFLRTEYEGRRMFFIFEQVDAFDDLKTQYFTRTSKVVALNFVDEVRNFKAMLHA